jgi:hypothetical protein
MSTSAESLTVIGMEYCNHDSARIWEFVRDIPWKTMLDAFSNRQHTEVGGLRDVLLTTHLASTPSINLIRLAVVSVISRQLSATES